MQAQLQQYSPDWIAAGFLPDRTTGQGPTGCIGAQPQVSTQALQGTANRLRGESADETTNTERLARRSAGSTVNGLAAAIISTCVSMGGGFSDPAREWRASTTDLNLARVSDIHARQPRVVAAKEQQQQVHQRLLTASIGVQTREALAALGITKSQMAEILGIQRPHLYEWIADKVERPDKGERLRDLLKVLDSVGISSRQPLRSHLLTEPLEHGGQPLVTLLKGDLDSPEISSALATARRLNRAIEHEAAERLERMTAAGHELGSDADRQATLEESLTMMEWDHS